MKTEASKQTAIVINVDGSERPLVPKNGSDFTCQELYDAIGDCDCISLHQLPDGRFLVVDDDGYSRGKETNQAASVLAFNIYQADLGIVGNVVVCGNDQIR